MRAVDRIISAASLARPLLPAGLLDWTGVLVLSTSSPLPDRPQVGTLPNGGCFLSSLAFFTQAGECGRTKGYPTAQQMHEAGVELRGQLCRIMQQWVQSLPQERRELLLLGITSAEEGWKTVDHYVQHMSGPNT